MRIKVRLFSGTWKKIEFYNKNGGLIIYLWPSFYWFKVYAHPPKNEK